MVIQNAWTGCLWQQLNCNHLFLHTLLYCTCVHQHGLKNSYIVLQCKKSDHWPCGYMLNFVMIFCDMYNLPLGDLSTGWLNAAELWSGSSWTVYWLTWPWPNCLLGDLTLPKLSSRWFDSTWTVYWLTWLAEFSTVWLVPGWTAYWVTWFYLNCDLTLAELHMSTEWPNSTWTVYWLTWLWLNCLPDELSLAELCTGWLDLI